MQFEPTQNEAASQGQRFEHVDHSEHCDSVRVLVLAPHILLLIGVVVGEEEQLERELQYSLGEDECEVDRVGPVEAVGVVLLENVDYSDHHGLLAQTREEVLHLGVLQLFKVKGYRTDRRCHDPQQQNCKDYACRAHVVDDVPDEAREHRDEVEKVGQTEVELD